MIVGYDRAEALQYIPADLMRVFVCADNSLPYYYDCYCNELKTLVTDGWFFFLDDDDVLSRPSILEELAQHLQDPGAIICQMLRNGMAKPRNAYIRQEIVEEGKIGLPCMVLHSRYRHIGALDGEKGGDYRYIKAVIDQIPATYICLPLVDAGARGHGQMGTIDAKIQKFQ